MRDFSFVQLIEVLQGGRKMSLIIHPLTFVSGLKFMETLKNEELRNVYGALLTLGITPQFFVDDYDAAMHSWLRVKFIPIDDNADSQITMPRFVVDQVLYNDGQFCTNILDIQKKADIHLVHLRDLKHVNKSLFILIYHTDNISRFYFTDNEKEVLNRGCNALVQGMLMGHYVYTTRNATLSDAFNELANDRNAIQQMYEIMVSKVNVKEN